MGFYFFCVHLVSITFLSSFPLALQHLHGHCPFLFSKFHQLVVDGMDMLRIIWNVGGCKSMENLDSVCLCITDSTLSWCNVISVELIFSPKPFLFFIQLPATMWQWWSYSDLKCCMPFKYLKIQLFYNIFTWMPLNYNKRICWFNGDLFCPVFLTN
jgi:hypothetical protein